MKKKTQKDYRVKKLSKELDLLVKFREDLSPGLQPKQLEACEYKEVFYVGQIDYLKELEPTQPKNVRYMEGFESARKWDND